MSKRKRDPTFTASEKNIIIELVEKHYHIVEEKKTNAATMKKKIKLWRLLADEFNAMSSIYTRDWSVLKNCWENLKKRAKQEQNLIVKGGSTKNLKDPAIGRVLELIQARVSVFVNCSDTDSTLSSVSGGNILSQEHIKREPTTIECLQSCDINVDDSQEWSRYNPSVLRTNGSQGLNRSPSPSPDVQDTVDMQFEKKGHQALSTPPRSLAAQEIPATTSKFRKRPFGRERKRNLERINTLLKANTHAEEQHAIQMNILRLREQKEEIILQQEKLKTQQEKLKLEILELEWKRLKKL